MSTSKFNPAYSKVTKSSGNPLSAAEWNALSGAASDAQEAINSLIDDIAALPSGGGSSVVSVSSKNNTEITSAKHINLEPAYVATGESGTYGDIQMKPGDDITLESSHRSLDKRNEITVKTANGLSGGAKGPVKLQVIAADITLSSKGKIPEGNDEANVMNVNVTTGSGKGYLKVRAQAIDLRCEEHGGVAIQPKGYDGDSHMNKIKFEHGGGDGLEFGTFNTEKTSLFTEEYRFRKDGIIKLATRTPVARATDGSDSKYDSSDPTTHYYYAKQADDFYDVVAQSDPTCTWEDLVKFVAWAKTNNFGPWAS